MPFEAFSQVDNIKSCTLKYIDNCFLAENCNVSDATAIKRCPLPVYLCIVYEV